MPKPKSADIKDRAAAGMQAFGKNPKKMKGPVAGSPMPPPLTNAPMAPIPPNPQMANTGKY